MKKSISWIIVGFLILIVVLCHVILATVLMFISNVIFLFTPDIRLRISWALARGVGRFALLLLGCPVRVSGFENLPYGDFEDERGNFCLISNHTSSLDIVALLAYGRVKLGFIAKKSLGRIPILHMYMKIAHCVFIDRKSVHSNIQAIRDGAENIKNGIPMLIFPEGTRSKTGKMLPFKSGSVKLATRSGGLIVPVVIKNLRLYLEDRCNVLVDIHRQPTIEYLRIIDPSRYPDDNALAKAVESAISQALDVQ